MKEKLEKAQQSMDFAKSYLTEVMKAAAEEGNEALYLLSMDMLESVGKYNQRLRLLANAA